MYFTPQYTFKSLSHLFFNNFYEVWNKKGRISILVSPRIKYVSIYKKIRRIVHWFINMGFFNHGWRISFLGETHMKFVAFSRSIITPQIDGGMMKVEYIHFESSKWVWFNRQGILGIFVNCYKLIKLSNVCFILIKYGFIFNKLSLMFEIYFIYGISSYFFLFIQFVCFFSVTKIESRVWYNWYSII